METRFLELVLSLTVLSVALPGHLGAGTPANNSTEPFTAGIHQSTSTAELGDLGHNASVTSYSSESLSPSQRNTLLSLSAEPHTAAGSLDSRQTETFTQTSRLSTGPLASTHVLATTEASSSSSSSSSRRSRTWRDNSSTGQTSGSSSAASWGASSWVSSEKVTLPQESPDTTHPDKDTLSSSSSSSSSSSFSFSRASTDTNGTFTFTTISRAGERTLLSVTSSADNSTSSTFTEDSNSHQPRWDVSTATETEDYTRRTDVGVATDQHTTRPFSSSSSVSSSGTQTLTAEPNITEGRHLSTSEQTSSDWTPSLGATQPNTDLPLQVSVSSAPPIVSPTGGSVTGTPEPRSSSGVETSTEASTGDQGASTQNQQGTEVGSYWTSEQSTGLVLTTGPPLVSSTSAELDSWRTVTATAEVTEVTSTTSITTTTTTSAPVTITHRLYVTEEETVEASTPAVTTTLTTTAPATPPPAATSPSVLGTAASTAATPSPTKAAAATTPLHTSSSPTASNRAPQSSSAPQPTTPSNHLQLPTAGKDTTRKTTTLRTSTASLEVTTDPELHTTTTPMQSSPRLSTLTVPTTRKEADRGTTQPAAVVAVGTTPAAAVETTEAPSPPLRNPCASNPCMNGGMCVSSQGLRFTCHCQQFWTGPTCGQDVDECHSSPCPLGSRCVNTRGSFSCECPLGFDLEDGRTCTRAKTFLGTFSVNRQPHDPLVFKSHSLHEIQRELIHLLNASLSVLRGYSRSVLSRKEENGVRISAVNMFSFSANVTSVEVFNSIQMSLSNCSSSLAHCRVVLLHKMSYHMESLCEAQKTQCNSDRSTCSDSSGAARCQCFQGYYKHNPEDQSCLECGDGYKLENGTCIPCMFGFGGFNCGNFYKLIAVVVSPAGGALLLILIIALIVTCRKKDKNDINKIIFKSGDMQMSPYADFPKNNRISMEWGRETIEMQENGSTKNLLQMTDIYYSPALRNSDLDRNGLYPFTGLPGSRHSCIYPAQWNPSFISDDSRRRDYF